MSSYSKLVAASATQPRSLERGDWINLLLALVAATGVVLAGVLL